MNFIESRDFLHFTLRYYTCRFLAKTLLITLFPAFFYLYGCRPVRTDAEESSVHESGVKTHSSGYTADNLHVFTYNRDSLQRLDSYQRFGKNEGNTVDICSRTGEKTIVLCGNCHYDRFAWQAIQSFGKLGDLTFKIENENPMSPLSSFITCTDKDGGILGGTPQLQPFLSEISVDEISVDFSGKSYCGKPLTDIRIYLTNLNADITLTQQEFDRPRRIVNHGSLNDEDMLNFLHPSMIYRNIGDIADGEQVMAGLKLYCYPNTSAEESAGSPFTRLVIEGKVNGHTYYYPINVNRPQAYMNGTGKGVERNYRYSYKIEIRRTGMEDPDIPVVAGQLSTSIQTEPWKEKPEYDIAF